jgi:hypothetical protein
MTALKATGESKSICVATQIDLGAEDAPFGHFALFGGIGAKTRHRAGKLWLPNRTARAIG